MQSSLPDSSEPSPLERALDQNASIQDAVEQSAAELCVIHAVLKQEVPTHLQTGDVAQALQKTEELENRIQSSADDLAQVNDALKQEITERAELERQLAQAQDALESMQQPLRQGHSPARSAASCRLARPERIRFSAPNHFQTSNRPPAQAESAVAAIDLIAKLPGQFSGLTASRFHARPACRA
jgi:septal ring factor EnvC (AmiA/AmiB activator)